MEMRNITWVIGSYIHFKFSFLSHISYTSHFK